MKRFAIALTALTLAAGAATAAPSGNLISNDRDDPIPAAATNIQVPAGQVMNAHELRDSGHSAQDEVSVSDFSTGQRPATSYER